MNMSYCAFENTTIAMNQILDRLKEAGTLQKLNLRREELAAYDSLVSITEQIQDEVERLDNGAESADY